ncbi:MAG: FHA domain-containing protein [Myxococcota bacterium]
MKVRIGDVLVEQGLITPSQLNTALEHQKRHPGYRKLGETILELRLVTEAEMLRALSKALRIQAIDLRQVTRIEPAALETLTVETAEKELVLPLRFVREGARKRLQVAMADPTNLAAIDELQFRLGCTVEPCLSTISHVRDAIRRFYRGSTLDMDGLIDLEPSGAGDEHDRADVIAGGDMRTFVGKDPDPGDSESGFRIVELKVFSGPAKGKAVQIPDGSEMVFGRGVDVDVTVDDHRMSRRHFQVTARADGVEVTDLGSSNGTFVNKRQVGRSALEDGDWVQAGNTLVKVQFIKPI